MQPRNRHIATSIGAALLVCASTVLVWATPASGVAESQAAAVDPQSGLPEEAKDLRIDEKLGENLSQEVRDIPFVDSEGNQVTLGQYLDGELPVILTFNYASCPMLCSSQLNGLVEGLSKLLFTPGEQFQIVTIALDHLETPDTAKHSKQQYVAQFPQSRRASIARGWHFLTGQKQAIRAVADSVGFPFRYVERDKLYAHPASLVFLSPNGVVTRYYHGIYYEPKVLNESIFKAGAGEHGVSAGFLLACLRPFHLQGHAKTGESVMRYGALGFALFLLAAFGTWQMRRTRHARREDHQE